ncbi:hypothetical protein V6N11_016801 [Hibiscus sabdariffa]|uniref:Uncharacterized protein n=1 Tax=Hibiscus sabdariffa TaxID=183260 RepID=A0ABR2TW20_9ROSI
MLNAIKTRKASSSPCRTSLIDRIVLCQNLTAAGRMVVEQQWRPVRVTEERGAAARPPFRVDEEAGVTVATWSRSGQSQMLAQIFAGQRG